MDFITGLPTSPKQNDAIMVVVDKLRKSTQFIAVKSTCKAIDITQVFMKEVFRLHGMPKEIVSDRDTKFTSNFWKSLMAGLETKLLIQHHLSPSNWRTDRKSEPNIRGYVKDACNASTQEMGRLPAIGRICLQQRLPSIEVLYGRQCNTPVSWSNPVNRIYFGPDMLKEMEQQVIQIKQNLKVTQNRQKSYADQ